MALETRKSGKQYYYRYYRTTDGKVVKRYIGCGPEATFAAETDRLKREERAAVRAIERRQFDKINEALEPLAAFEAAYEGVLQAALSAAGFYYRKGEWRR